MTDLKINGRQTVGRLKYEFKKEYGLTLRVYEGKQFADEEVTLASLASKKVEEFSASGNMLVGNFEKKFEEATGLKVQVASPNDKELVSNINTLSERNKFYQDPKYSHL